ncbi:co-chaperone protein SBA1-like [Salvia hispanica]|uniref:co-chaperone protein SBA1-like n=1 Tax=Salvia hispanica TaxID=49212 RepID=UPI00200993E3|nr:co-chaperone protein SBA1-like [Salvia hispanica]
MAKGFLTVVLPDAKNPKVNVDPNGTFTFSASGGADNNLYELKLDLLDKINVEESKINIGEIFCVLEKAEQKWWKKLLRGDEKIHYVKVDWDKWVDEDDGMSDIRDRIFASEPQDCCRPINMHGPARSLGCQDRLYALGGPPPPGSGYTLPPKPSISRLILEAVADYRPWIWHAYFGVVWPNNDINASASPPFNDRAMALVPLSLAANGNQHNMGYYFKMRYTPTGPLL